MQNHTEGLHWCLTELVSPELCAMELCAIDIGAFPAGMKPPQDLSLAGAGYQGQHKP